LFFICTFVVNIIEDDIESDNEEYEEASEEEIEDNEVTTFKEKLPIPGLTVIYLIDYNRNCYLLTMLFLPGRKRPTSSKLIPSSSSSKIIRTRGQSSKTIGQSRFPSRRNL
jgi:hypothetical protein